MSGEGPFRGDLDAAHRRIEQLTADYESRITELQDENARLRKRLIDGDPKPQRKKLAMFGVATFLSCVALLALVVLFVMRESSPQPVVIVEPPQPVRTSRDAQADLPTCKCESGDPLCAEIPGLTCAPLKQ